MNDETAARPLRLVAGLVGRFVAVVGAVAAALLLLDAVPWLLAGVVRGVTAHPAVEAAEAALGAKLLLPARIPESYRLQPGSLRTVSRPVRAASLVFAPVRAGRSPVLFVQSLGEAPVPEALLPAGKEFHRIGFDLGGTPAVLAEVLLPPDGTFQDVTFASAGRRIVFRFQGEPEEVLEMARSLPRAEPR